MTIAESKNDSLEKEKGELEGAIKSMKSVKSESGTKSCYGCFICFVNYYFLTRNTYSGYKTKFVRFAPDTTTESESESDVSDTCLSRSQDAGDMCLNGKFCTDIACRDQSSVVALVIKF